jgi:hypothetical protein
MRARGRSERDERSGRWERCLATWQFFYKSRITSNLDLE